MASRNQESKGRKPTDRKSGLKSRAERDPLEINLTLVIRTGPDPVDRFTIMNNRKIPMVGSVFEYRNRIQRFVVRALLKVASSSPAVYREVAPGLAALMAGKRKSAKASSYRSNSRPTR